MRAIVGPVLSFVGGFLLAVALLAQFYMGDALLKTPLDVNTVIHLDGHAKLANGKGGYSSFPVIATSTYHTNTALSDFHVASFENAQCLLKNVGTITGCVSAKDPQKRLLAATTDNFATDRRTAEPVNDPSHLPAGSTSHSGLINKWPFLSEKKDYTSYDTTTREANDAAYSGTSELNGHEAYVYDVKVDNAPSDVAKGVPGFYTDDKQIFIDPMTGAILDQREHQVHTDKKDNVVLDLHLAFTKGQVGRLVDEADANGKQLKLIRSGLPLIGYVVGIPLLLIGLFLTVRGRRSRGRRAATEAPQA